MNKVDDAVAELTTQGVKRIGVLLNAHARRVLAIRKEISIPDTQLVSDTLGDQLPFYQVPTRIRINSLREELKKEIYRLASEYEADQVKAKKQAIEKNSALNKLRLEQGKEIIDIH